MEIAVEHLYEVSTTPRVLQIAGMFDLPLDEKLITRIDAKLPIEERPWSVGLVVGPSGSGKSSLARQAWPGRMIAEQTWSDDGALLDDFPAEASTKDVVGLLTAVGLGSPPAWVRPFRTLSNGEAFRASIARALADTAGLVVVDEFTSVVDRQVAKVASHTVQKAVRRSERQFVAVTCHYDVVDWLQPDWLYDLATNEFAWRSVQPHPRLDLRIFKVNRAVWPMFRRHHYLSADLMASAQCFGAWIGDQLVGFTSYRHFPHPHAKNIKIGHRTVVLPDYQGLGISGRMAEFVGQYLYERGYRYRRVIAHPAVIAHCSRSPRWRDTSAGKRALASTSGIAGLHKRQIDPRYLGTRSFEYQPPARGARTLAPADEPADMPADALASMSESDVADVVTS